MKYKKLIIFMPSIEGGGVEKNLFIVTNFLSKKINNVSVISASKNHYKKFNRKVNFITPKSYLWDSFGRRIKYFTCLLILIKEIIKTKNIVVFSFQANIYCIIVCKIFRIKIISRSNSSPSGWSKNLIKRFIFRTVLNMADQVMVNSLEFKGELKKKLNVNSICIYNPLNTKEIIAKSKKKINIDFFQKDTLNIVNVGRYVDQKDQITLLRAINNLKNKIKIRLVIMGKGGLKKNLLNYIFNNNLQKIVKLINFTDNPYALINKAELFILTSKYEGLPNVLLEALALKKFIISSDCPTGPKEILLNGKGGLLFKTGNYNSLKRKIIYYTDNKKKCRKMLKNSLLKLKRFDLNINLMKYLNLTMLYLKKIN